MSANAAAPAPAMTPNTPPPVLPAELAGLRRARAAALTNLITLLLALVAPLVVIIVSGVEIHYGGFHIGSGKFSNRVFEDAIAVVTVGVLIGLVTVVLYMLSFASFRKVQPGFGGPLVLVVIGILGTLMILVGIIGVLQQFLSAVSCVGSNTTSSCVSISTIEGSVLLVFFGLFLAFLGWIGLLIGIYRIGKRYDSTLTKVGAILTIIPVVSIIAPILVFIGIHGACRKLEARAAGGPAT